MSIIERGKEKQQAEDERAREFREQRERENHDHTIRWFRRDFYRDHFKANPEWKGYYSREPRMIADPPFPEIEGWHVLNPEGTYAYGDPHMASEFVCEGLTYRCVWKFEGTGGDRAYWDDGWWPDWFVRARVPLRFFPFIKVKKWVKVYGPEAVAEAVSV